LGSPLNKALLADKGEIVDVQTPTGPVKFNRQGQRVYSGDEYRQMMDAQDRSERGQNGGQGFKEWLMGGALSTLAGGGKLIDEIQGARKASGADGFSNWLTDKLAGTPSNMAAPSPVDVYRNERDRTRRDVARATDQTSPTVEVFGAKIPVLPVVGAALPQLFAPNPATWGGRVLASGTGAAIDEMGGSNADLTRGEGAQFVGDVGGAGAMGVGAGGAAEALGVPFRALSKRIGAEAGLAKDAVADATQAARDKAVRSAVGDVGRVTATQGNAMETVMEVLRNPQWFDDAVVQAAYKMAESPEGKLLLSRAAQNNMTKLAQSLSAEDVAREGLRSATSAAAPAAVAGEVAQKVAPGSIASDLGQKAWRSIGQRAALGTGGAAVGLAYSSITGSDRPTSMLVGAGLGNVGPGMLMFMRNQAKSPVVQFGALKATQGMLDSALSGLSAGSRAAAPVIKTTQGENARAAQQNAYQSLMQRFGISAKSKQQLADEAFLQGQNRAAR